MKVHFILHLFFTYTYAFKNVFLKYSSKEIIDLFRPYSIYTNHLQLQYKHASEIRSLWHTQNKNICSAMKYATLKQEKSHISWMDTTQRYYIYITYTLY